MTVLGRLFTMSPPLDVPQRLLDLLESGEYVLFLGAGVSVEAGIPGWPEALSELGEGLNPLHAGYAALMKSEATAARFLEAAELLYLAPIQVRERVTLLQQVFDRELTITRRLKLLALTRCQGIVTTNFDRGLDHAAVEANVSLTRFGESDQDLAAARVSNAPFLVRLHGRIEVAETLIFAEHHYRALPDRPQYIEFFRELFINRNLVFFGFSFVDPVISTLMASMANAVRAIFRRDAFALVPQPLDPRLREALQQSGITPVPYPPDDMHAAAWNLIAAYRTGPAPASQDAFEAERVRRNLATAYARAKGRQFSADRERMLAALMLPILAAYGANTVVPVEEFIQKVEAELALPRRMGRETLKEALQLLERDGSLALQGEDLLVGDTSTSDELAKDAARLASGVIARAELRHGTKILKTQLGPLEHVITMALAVDGLHLAHTLIRRQPLDPKRVEHLLAEAIDRVGLDARYRETALAALKELFAAPDAEEEQILSNISAVVFGTAVLLSDPMLAGAVSTPFERGAYIDTSVLLPWLAQGHPLQQAYDSLIRSFEAHRIRVLDGYLNEVISHRRLAIEAARDGRFDDLARFKRYSSLFELHNINVFLGGYAGSLEQGFEGNFEAYLKTVAPYQSEGELRRHLESLGITIDKHVLKDRGIAGELKAALRERGKTRDDIVIAHDASQLETLKQIRDLKVRPFFVTADRTLISSLPNTSCRYLLEAVLLPQQVAYLAQMANRTSKGFQAFSRTLWSVGSSVAEKVKRYYTDRVLREYEDGLVAELPRLLEVILADMKDEGLDLDDDTVKDPRSEQTRVKFFERLDRFEPKFYEYMAEARSRAAESRSSD